MSKKSILWIENELEYYSSLIEYLQDLNYDVHKAWSAEEGLKKLRNITQNYSLIIMDILMGYTELEGISIENGRTGYVLFNIIRNKLKLNIPILIYTVLIERDDIKLIKNTEEIMKTNFTFIRKPLSPTELADEVKKIIGESD